MLRNVENPFKLDEDKAIYTLDDCLTLSKTYNGKNVVFEASTEFDSFETIGNDELLNKIYLLHPWIETILKDGRFVLKGSALLEALNSNIKAADFDFYMVGVSSEDIPKAQLDFLNYITTTENENISKANEAVFGEEAKTASMMSYKGNPPPSSYTRGRYNESSLSYGHSHHKIVPDVKTSNVFAYSNGSTLTIHASTIDKPIQLVFTTDTTVEDLIFKVGFALSGLVLNRDGMVGSLASFYSLMNRIIFIGTNNNPTCSFRLHKYVVEKNFGLCIEGLFIDKIPKDRIDLGISDVFDICGLKIIYFSIQQNIVLVKKFISKSHSDSGLGTYTKPLDKKINPVPSIFTHNIGILMNILHDRKKGLHKELSEYIKCTQFYGKNVLLKQMFERPFLEQRHIQVHFNNILEKFNTDAPNIPVLKKYFMQESLPVLSTTLFSDDSADAKKIVIKELIDTVIPVLYELLDEIVEYCKKHPMLYRTLDGAFSNRENIDSLDISKYSDDA